MAWLRSLPDGLSLFRLAAAPALLALALAGAADAFAWLLGASLASDVVDGWLARRLGATSTRGARLDSWGDLATYSVLPVGVLWLWPEWVREQLAFVALALAAYVLPVMCGWIKFRRLTSYHTWGAKASAVGMGAALALAFAGGPAWPFHAAVWLLAAEAFEEIAITCVLRRWAADVPTWWHARRLARAQARSRVTRCARA